MRSEGKNSDLSNWLVVVPARLGSQRLPRKPLADLAGKPLVVRVLENLEPLVRLNARVVCATDSEEVCAEVKSQGFEAVMTRQDHESGTDRCAEVARKFAAKPLVLNVQGDEPFVATDDLIGLCQTIELTQSAEMGTLVYRSTNQTHFFDPNVVKVVIGSDKNSDFALYFSRAPIPFARDSDGFSGSFYQHLGVYGFKRQHLLEFASLAPSAAMSLSERKGKFSQPLEATEKLEQLRALQAGWKIVVSEATHVARGIDTQEDLAAAREIFLQKVGRQR